MMLLLLAALGFAAGPPELPVADVGFEGARIVVEGVRPGARDAVPLPPAWWSSLGDPALDAIIVDAFAASPELGAAASRVEQSRALVRQQRAGLLPQANLVVSTSTQPFEAVGFQFGGLGGVGGGVGEEPPDVIHSGSAMVQAAWDLDVFGRQAALTRATRHDAAATTADAGRIAVALTQQIASAYYDQVAAQARIRAVEEQLQAARDLLEVLQLRFERGEASGLDVLQQRQQVSATESLLPTVRAQDRVAAQRLAVLMGRSPSAPVRDVPSELPGLAPLPLDGIPAALVAERPDLLAAEARVEAAGARRVAAIRALLPTIRVTGGLGYQANKFVEWSAQDTWTVGSSLNVPLYLGGGLRAAASAARAAEDAATWTYAQQLLAGLEQAGVAFALEEERRDLLGARLERLDDARVAYGESRARFAQGLATYLEVLTAYNALLAAELDVIQARRDLVAARIQLHDALGGAPLSAMAQETVP